MGADPRRWAPRARQASRRCSAAARPGGCGTPVLRTTLTCLPAARSPSISSTVPEGATPVRVPSRMANIATPKSARENLGLGGRPVLVSRQWSGKTLSEHRADRATVVREALTSAGIGAPELDPMAASVTLPDGSPRFVWTDTRPDADIYARVILASGGGRMQRPRGLRVGRTQQRRLHPHPLRRTVRGQFGRGCRPPGRAAQRPMMPPLCPLWAADPLRPCRLRAVSHLVGGGFWVVAPTGFEPALPP